MREQINHIADWVERHSLSVRIGLVVVVVAMASIQLVMLSQQGYTSDDVSQQTLLSQWQRGYSQVAWVGDDSWYLKYPLYVVTNQLDVSPYSRAFITSWILTMTTLIGVLLVLWEALKLARLSDRGAKLVGVVLPAAAVIALSPTALQVVGANNTRNIEVPIFLLLIYLLLRYDQMTERPSWRWVLGVTGLAALLLADDPIFKYMGAAPLLVVVAWRWLSYRETTPRAVYIGGLTVLSVVLAAVVVKFVEVVLPLEYLVHPAIFTGIDEFYINARTMASQNLNLFGANFWGLPRGMTLLMAVVNLGLLVLSLGVALRLLLRSLRLRGGAIGTHFLGLLPFWIIAIVLMASFHAETRYLILLPFVLMLALVTAVGRGMLGTRLAVAVVAGLLIVGGYNVWMAGRTLATTDAVANREERVVADILREQGLVKGMAPYWRANITTFMSNNTVDVMSVYCGDGVVIDQTLAERGILTKPAERSFILSYPVGRYGHTECSSTSVERQFGAPAKVVDIPTSERGRILIYDRDITQELR